MSNAHTGFEAVANAIVARRGVSIEEARSLLASNTRSASVAAWNASPHLKKAHKTSAAVPKTMNEEDLSKFMDAELDDFAKALDSLPLIARTTLLIKYHRMCATGEFPLAKDLDTDDSQDANQLAPDIKAHVMEHDGDVIPGDSDDKTENAQRAADEAVSVAADLAQAKANGKANSGGVTDKPVDKAEKPKALKKVNAFRPLLSSLVSNIQAHVAASGGGTVQTPVQPNVPQATNATPDHAPKGGAAAGNDPGANSAFGKPTTNDKNSDGYNEPPPGGVTPGGRDVSNSGSDKTEGGPGFDPNAVKEPEKSKNAKGPFGS